MSFFKGTSKCPVNQKHFESARIISGYEMDAEHYPTDPHYGPKVNDCCEQFLRKLKETERTISGRDAVIEMLQAQLRKMEERYLNNLDEIERLRCKYAQNNQNLGNLKNICLKLEEENHKLIQDKANVIKHFDERKADFLQIETDKWKAQYEAILSKLEAVEHGTSTLKNLLNLEGEEPVNPSEENESIEELIRDQNRKMQDFFKIIMDELQICREGKVELENSLMQIKETLNACSMYDKLNFSDYIYEDKYEKDAMELKKNIKCIQEARFGEITSNVQICAMVSVRNDICKAMSKTTETICQSFGDSEESLEHAIDGPNSNEDCNPCCVSTKNKVDNLETKVQEYYDTIAQLEREIECLDASINKVNRENIEIKNILVQKDDTLNKCINELDDNQQKMEKLSLLIESILCEKDRCQTQVKNLNCALTNANCQLARLQGLLQERENELERLKEQYEATRLELQNEKQNSEQLRKECENNRDSRGSLQAELSYSLGKIAALSDQLDCQNEAYKDRENQLRVQICELEKNISVLQGTLNMLSVENKKSVCKINDLNGLLKLAQEKEEEYKKTISQLENCRDCMKSSYEEVKEELDSLKSSYEKLLAENSELKALENESELLKAKFKEMEENLAILEQKFDESLAYNEELNSKLEELQKSSISEEEKDRLNKEKEQIMDELNACQAKLQSVSDSLAKKEEEFSSLEKQMQDLIDERNNDSNSAKQMEIELECLKKEICQLESDKLSLQEELGKANKKIDDLQSELDKKSGENSHVLCKIDHLVIELSELKKQSESMQEHIDCLSKQLESKDEEIKSLNCRLDACKTFLSTETKLKESLKSHVQQLKSALEESREELDKMREKVENLNCENSRLGNEMECIANKNDVLQRVIKECQCKDYEKEIDRLNKLVTELETVIQRLEYDNLRKQSAVNNLKGCIDKCNCTLDVCETEMKHLQAELDCLKEANKDLKNENQELTSKLCKTQGELNACLDSSQAKEIILNDLRDQAQHYQALCKQLESEKNVLKTITDNLEKEIAQNKVCNADTKSNDYDDLRKEYDELKCLMEKQRSSLDQMEKIQMEKSSMTTCPQISLNNLPIQEEVIEEFKTKISDKNVQIKSFQEKIENEAAKICYLKNYVNKLMLDNRQLKQAISNLINSLESKIKGLDEGKNCISVHRIASELLDSMNCSEEKNVSGSSANNSCDCMSIISSNFKSVEAKLPQEIGSSTEMFCLSNEEDKKYENSCQAAQQTSLTPYGERRNVSSTSDCPSSTLQELRNKLKVKEDYIKKKISCSANDQKLYYSSIMSLFPKELISLQKTTTIEEVRTLEYSNQDLNKYLNP